MKILNLLNEYPGQKCHGDAFIKATEMEVDTLCLNLAYLANRKLVRAGQRRSVDGIWYFGFAEITSDGIDYLSEDGGLSAELNVVHIKLMYHNCKA